MNLEVISVNLWQILISLCNLVILFLIIKKFLYKPVRRVLAQRQEQIAQQYAKAQAAQDDAEQNQQAWSARMAQAQAQADAITKSATDDAKRRGEAIVHDAQAQAQTLIAQAKTDAELEKKKAEDDLRQQIVVVSTALAEKLLEREIDPKDHQQLINTFIEKLGDDDDAAE